MINFSIDHSAGNVAIMEERRRHPRFHVREGAYAFIDNVPFMIQDVSEGGLKIQSVIVDDVPQDNVKVDIFVNKDAFYLKDLSVHLVSMLQGEATTPFSPIRVKRFGFEFGELSEQQKLLVDNFITHNTVGEA